MANVGHFIAVLYNLPIPSFQEQVFSYEVVRQLNGEGFREAIYRIFSLDPFLEEITQASLHRSIQPCWGKGPTPYKLGGVKTWV